MDLSIRLWALNLTDCCSISISISFCAQFIWTRKHHINHRNCEKFFTLFNEICVKMCLFVWVCVRIRCVQWRVAFKFYVTKIDWNWFSRSIVRTNHSFRKLHMIIHFSHAFVFIRSLWYIGRLFVCLFYSKCVQKSKYFPFFLSISVMFVEIW